MKKNKLYLDDIRIPKTKDWIIVRNYEQFVNYITEKGLPDIISFDHDLADNKQGREVTGYDCAKWLCTYCSDNGLPLPEWNVHSANPVGRQNINHLLESYKKKYDLYY